MNKLFLIALFAGAVAAQVAPATNKECETAWAPLCGAQGDACDNNKDLSTTLAEFALPACEAYVKAAVTADPCTQFQVCLDKVIQVAADAVFAKFCPADKANCVDTDAFCATWSAASPSECGKNPSWMLDKCSKSCCPICGVASPVKAGECPTDSAVCVVNSNAAAVTCAAWAAAGECDKNTVWMRANCMQSCCDKCFLGPDGCATTQAKCSNVYADEVDVATMIIRTAKVMDDNNALCKTWSDAGECTNNSKWMLKNCGNECCATCKPAAPVRAPVAAPALASNNINFNQQFAQPINFGGYGSFGGYGGLGNGFGNGFGNVGLPYRG